MKARLIKRFEDEITLRDDLRLTLGARLERNDYTGYEFLPTARLAWMVTPDHLLWTAATRTVRAPSRLDRDTFIPGSPPFLLTGGPDVRSEIAKVYELGYRGQPASRFSYSATAFYADYDHLRTQEIAPSFTSVFFANEMEGHTKGVEMWGSWHVMPTWRLRAGYTALSEKLRLKPGSNDFMKTGSAQLFDWYAEEIKRDYGRTLVRPAGLSLKSVPFYHEVLVPNGVAHGSGMATGLPMGEAWLSVGYTRPAADPWGAEPATELLRLLLPAFKAGANTFVQLDERRDSLTDALDSFGHAVLTCGLDGRELHRSAHLRRILADDPEEQRLLVEMRTLAESVSGLRRRPSKTMPLVAEPVGQRTVTTARMRYHLRATFVDAGVCDDGSAVLVALVEHAARLPDAAWLMERYRLTPREAEVALLLAIGASNRQIAHRLGISPFTTRAHVERIFQKMEIHSRKALALAFLSDQRASG